MILIIGEEVSRMGMNTIEFHVRISFCSMYKPFEAKEVMNAQPNLGSLATTKAKRSYCIVSAASELIATTL